MRRNHSVLYSFTRYGLSAVFALGLVAQIQAQDKKTDPTGTWTWTTPGRNGGPDRKMSLKLKLEDDKLTGVLVSPGRQGTSTETKIEDGKVTDDTVSFTVSREFNGNKMTFKYKGKVTGDTIKGKVESERGDRDWEAKKETEKK